MDIKQEITQIILANDFTIVPGFGAFLHEYPKPSFDAEGNLIAFDKQLRFENLLKVDYDGKIFEKLHQVSYIPKSLIANELEDFILRINNELKSKKRFNWEGIGSFFINDQNQITFFQEKRNHVTQTSVENKPSEVIEKVLPSRIFNQTKEEILVDTEPGIVDNFNIRKKENSYTLSSFLYLTPLLCLIGGLGYVIFFKPSQKNAVKVEQRNLDSLDTFTSPVKVDSFSTLSESEFKIDRSKESPFAEQNNDEIVEKDGTIISIGVYKSRINVDSLAQTLAENGVPVKVRPYKGKFKLFVVSYNDAQTNVFVSKIKEVTGENPIIGN